MIWPWSDVGEDKLMRRIDALEKTILKMEVHHEITRAEYYKLTLAMRGAHKGIWRLKQKRKKYEKAQEVTHSNFNRQLFERAPCYLCVYNGELYYQPTKHPCAKLYHQRVEGE